MPTTSMPCSRIQRPTYLDHQVCSAAPSAQQAVPGLRCAGAPIGEYLYSIKAEWDEKAARLREVQQRRAQKNAASTFVNNRSEVRAVQGGRHLGLVHWPRPQQEAEWQAGC